MADVIILGAGISGLSCAWSLKILGIESLVLESAGRVGGVIHSERTNGYLVECGPNSILPSEDSTRLIEQANLIHEVIEASPRAPRFICVNGTLKKAPLGAMSLRGTMRMLSEPFIRSRGMGEESVSEFFTRRIGKEAHDRLVAPFVSGIYAGNTSELSMSAAFPRLVEFEQKFGSLTLGMLRSRKKKSRRKLRTCSFMGGMETLPRRLSEHLNIRLNYKDGRLGEARVTVVTVPSYSAVGIVEKQNASLARFLENVEYAPVVVAAASLPASAFPKPIRGFGFLVPRSEGLHILGTLFSSSLFPGRAPKGRVLFTTFLGGAFEPEAIEWSDDQVWDVVCSELQRTLKTSVRPDPVQIVRHRKAIPQYKIGHNNWLAGLREQMSNTSGLFMTANYIDGISVAACMEQAERTALAVAKYLRSTK